MEQREIAGFTDKPVYMGRVEHYYLAGSSRPIEHAELGLQAYHTPSLPGQQPEQSGSFNKLCSLRSNPAESDQRRALYRMRPG